MVDDKRLDGDDIEPEVFESEPDSIGVPATEEEPAAKDSVEEPLVDSPSVDQPDVDAPPVDAPPAELPSAEDPAVDVPPAEDPAADSPPAVDPPADTLPAGEPSSEPAVDEPATDEPAADEPAADEASIDDPAGDAATADLDAGESPVAAGDTAQLTAIEDSLAAEPLVEGGEAPEMAPIGDDAALADQLLDPNADQTAVLPAADAAVGAAAGDAVADGGVRDIDLGPERGSNLWVWIGLLVGVLITAAVIGYGYWYLYKRPIPVPELTGKQPAQATQIINDVGLHLGKLSETPTDSAPPGTIIDQSPKSGVEVEPNTAVSFVVAAPPEVMKVPDVTGRAIDEAASTLAKERLPFLQAQSYSATAPAGYVISQLPTGGGTMAPGDPVGLIVSAGPPPGAVTVPHLMGLNESDAVSWATAINLQPRVFRSYEPSISPGIVITQTPLPGNSVSANGYLPIAVSLGAGTGKTVPTVTRDKRAAAEKELKAAGFKPVILLATSSTVPKGIVISQMPGGGKRTAVGQQVGIVVSRGPNETAPVPSLKGLTSEEASRQIGSAGFTGAFVKVQSAEATAGATLAQWPAPGFSYTLRSPILVLFAKQ